MHQLLVSCLREAAKNDLFFGAGQSQQHDEECGEFDVNDYSATSLTDTGPHRAISTESEAAVFVDFVQRDFHLAPGSKAQDSGTALGAACATDIDDEPRGLDGAWDCGFDEAGAP